MGEISFGSHCALWISGVLTALSLVAFAIAGKKGVPAIVASVVVLVAIILNLLWFAIDRVTGQGVNAAALYHIRYGFSGAGLSGYRMLICSIVLGTFFAVVVIGWVLVVRNESNRNSTRMWCLGLLLTSGGLITSPAFGDILGAPFRSSKGTSYLPTNADASAKHHQDFAKVYIPPYAVPITEASSPNLIYIYAEGLERTFFDEDLFPGLMKELRQLDAEAVSFTDVGQVAGAGWTMAGIVASQCGIPLAVPPSSYGNSMSGMDAFLPGARALSDILKERSYHLCFMGGGDSRFAGKNKFFFTHQFDEVLGREELLPQAGAKEYVSSWGLYDDTLLSLAFDKIQQLGERRRPFALYLLTLDSHPPTGHPSRSVAEMKYGDGSNPMLNAVAGADALIGGFVRRIRQSRVGANTVIVLASDHLSLNSTATSLLAAGRRRNLLMIFPQGQLHGKQIETPGTTLDIGSTLLPYLGLRGAVGLGKDLLDPSVDPVVRNHIIQNCQDGTWNNDLASFWNFPRFCGEIEIDPDKRSIYLDDRTFKAPALIRIGDDGTATFSFGIMRELEQAALDRQSEDRFLLITPKGHARTLLRTAAGDPQDWYLITGRTGRIDQMIRLEGRRSFSTQDLTAGVQGGSGR